MKTYKLDEKIDFLRSYGFNESDINKIINSKLSGFGISVDNIKQKIGLFESLGFSKEEIIYILSNAFYIISRSIESIKNTIKLYDDMGLRCAIVTRPRYLLSSIYLVYSRYQYLASIGININEGNYYRLFFTNKKFEELYGISREKLLSKYNFNKYLSGEEKLLDVADVQRLTYLKDIADKYYETRDIELRNKLIYAYMPLCQGVVSKYADSDNKDDLLQIAYETLIKAIDSYVPKDNANYIHHIGTHIVNYVNTRILSELKKENKEESINGLDIYSNSSIEGKVIEKVYIDELMKMIYDYLDEYSSYKYIQIFKELYGIGCEIKTLDEICRENNCSHQFVNDCEIKTIGRLYFYMKDKVKYFPSSRLLNWFKSNRLYKLIPADIYREIENIRYADYKYLEHYSDCDSLSDSHSVLIRKRK